MVKYVLKLYLLLQLILLASWFIGSRLIPIKMDTFLGKNLGEFQDNSLIWSRANFDGFYYAKIARDGYQYLQQAFFPFYPNLIEFCQKLFKSFFSSETNLFILSGIFISNLAFLLILGIFWELLALENVEEKIIKKTLFLLVIFPTSFYFLSVYTESLFLFLVLLSFYFAGKSQYFWAGIIAGFASYTRLVGIFLLPALLLEYYYQVQVSRRGTRERLIVLKNWIIQPKKGQFVQLIKSRLPHLKNLFFISFSSWGLVKYMFYLKETCGDWFYFVKVQPGFGAQRSVEKIILLYQVFWRYLKMIVTVYPKQWIYFNIWFEFMIALFFLVILIIGWLQKEKYKIRESWLIFATLAYLLPTLTGTFSSLPRYVLVCFPCFLLLGQIITNLKRKFTSSQFIYILSSIFLLILSSMFFFRGYWIG